MNQPPNSSLWVGGDDQVPIDAERLARNWRAIVVELDAPKLSRLERVLRRLGMPSHLTRLMVATPALRTSWFVALALIVVVGLVLTDGTDARASAFALLLLAPLGPVLGVALAYGTASDPAHEIHLATAVSGIQLLMTRVAAVMFIAIPFVTVFALLSPVTRPWAAAWLLPALAVSAAALALMTVTTPRRAAAGATIGWLAVNIVARAVVDDALAAFLPVGQIVALVAVLGFGAVIVTRRAAFDRLALT